MPHGVCVAARIGLRFPVEIGLIGDARLTLQALNPLLKARDDPGFLRRCQQSMADWRAMRQRVVTQNGHPLKPQEFASSLGPQLAPDAIIACDSGHNTGVCARYVDVREDQMFGVSGSMACGLPYAMAASLAFQDRQVVAVVGDGGLTMLLGELATAVRYRLPVKISVLKNNVLAQIKWKQMLFLGNPEYECDLQPVDFAGVALAMGLAAFRIRTSAECGPVIARALSAQGPALVEVAVDPNEPLLPPKRREKFVRNLEAALQKGTPGRAEIERALAEEPARSQLAK